jgi:8-amino-7-oxononanoate synthase
VPGADGVVHKLAALQGCERATLAPSTLHLFWDLFGLLARSRVAIYLDAGTYPVAQWGVERAAARGVVVRRFPHHNAGALHQRMQQDLRRGLRPVVVADGYCPLCGRLSPIPAYLASVRAHGGYLILDDTQALGILGHSPEPKAPYGKGGGGSLRWHQVRGPEVVLISSLAKGFGVPVAVLAGSEAVVRRFEECSETRVHCSPPSVAVVHAAEQALAVNRNYGDALRLILAQLVCHFRRRLAEAGFRAAGGLSPVQTLAPVLGLHAAVLHDRLSRAGLRTVLRRVHAKQGARISFLLTARHRFEEIDRALDQLADTVAQTMAIKAKNPEATYAVPIRVRAGAARNLHGICR